MKRINAVFLLSLVMGLMGCTFSGPISPTAIPTITETITPTKTLVPSATFTLTPVVTLSPEQWEQQFDIILDMVNTPDAGCTLPCWWGITPGETTWADAGRILDQAGLAVFGYSEIFFVAGTKFTEEDLLQLNVEFYSHEKIVNHIIISNFDTPSIIFKALSPEQLIPGLGIPTRVVLRQTLSPGEGPTTGFNYSMYIFYDDVGIYFHYVMATHYDYADPICPTFEEGGNTGDWLKIILKSLDDKTPLENYDAAYYPELSFEIATGKSLEDFYQAYLQTNNPPCFDVLPDVFEP